jgi:hypothetical protein
MLLPLQVHPRVALIVPRVSQNEKLTHAAPNVLFPRPKPPGPQWQVPAMHAVPLSPASAQSAQVPPAVPHAASSPMWHAPFWQQPLGQPVASQTQEAPLQ